MTLREKLERMHRCVGTYGAQDLVSDEEIMSLLDVALAARSAFDAKTWHAHEPAHEAMGEALDRLDKALGE